MHIHSFIYKHNKFKLSLFFNIFFKFRCINVHINIIDTRLLVYNWKETWHEVGECLKSKNNLKDTWHKVGMYLKSEDTCQIIRQLKLHLVQN